MSAYRYLPLVPTQAMLDAPLSEGSSASVARHESRRDLRPLIWAAMAAAAPDPDSEALGRASYALGRLASLASIAYDDLYGDMEPDDGSTMLAGWVADVRAALEPRQDNPAPVQPLVPHPLQSGFPRPASVVLSDLAAQEGCDGEPYDTMQRVADALRKESDQ